MNPRGPVLNVPEFTIVSLWAFPISLPLLLSVDAPTHTALRLEYGVYLLNEYGAFFQNSDALRWKELQQ